MNTGESLVEKVKDMAVSPEASRLRGSLTTHAPTELSKLYDLINEIKGSLDQHRRDVNKQVSDLAARVSEMNVNINTTIQEEVRKSTKSIEDYIDG